MGRSLHKATVYPVPHDTPYCCSSKSPFYKCLQCKTGQPVSRQTPFNARQAAFLRQARGFLFIERPNLFMSSNSMCSINDAHLYSRQGHNFPITPLHSAPHPLPSGTGYKGPQPDPSSVHIHWIVAVIVYKKYSCRPSCYGEDRVFVSFYFAKVHLRKGSSF